MKPIIIAIDGESGCGKSSTAKAVAEALNYTYIDTGAMYRAVTFFALGLDSLQAVKEKLGQIKIEFRPNTANPSKRDTYLNGANVEQAIRGMEVSQNVSEISAIPEVRQAMVAQQREMGENKAIVMDGRDIATNVFPQAELKIFMSARVEVKAQRRQAELAAKGEKVALESIIENLRERDRLDRSRKTNPLIKDKDAIEVDTSDKTFAGQVQIIVDLAKAKITEVNA